MKLSRLSGILLGLFLVACASDEERNLSGANGKTVASACDPGPIFERLEKEMKTGLAGADQERISRVYNEYFRIVRICDKTQDMTYVVKQEYADKRTAAFLGFPPPPPYIYTQKKSRKGELCLSREGSESSLISAPKWYCEKGGWSDNI